MRSAARPLFDRGHGKPAKAIEVNTGPDLTDLSDEDIGADSEAPGLPAATASQGVRGVARRGEFVRVAGKGPADREPRSEPTNSGEP
jgi:hypothetical protein